MAKPKLALIPAAQGTSLYSVLPSSGVGDFSFTRSGSATRINSQGLIETVGSGVSRLNYSMIDGVVKGCPHHILEPQRTNYVQYSSDASSWSSLTSGGTVTKTGSYAISPDGTQTATRLQASVSGSGYALITLAVDSSFVGNYTSSVYVKSNTNSNQEISFYGRNSTNNAHTVGSEWQRIEFQGSSSTGQTNLSYIGVSTSVTSEDIDILVWGGQLEEGSYATSYIPTNGSSVTRSAETANGSGDAATFNDSEGVLMAEISALDDDLTNRYISISDGTANNRILIRYIAGFSNTVGLFAVVGGTEQATLLYEVNDILDNIKVLIKYKQNDYSLWVNGFEVDTDTTGIVPSENTLDRLNFANIDGSTFPFYGKTKQLQYFDTALTDSELEQLTSWVSFQEMAEGQLYTIE